MPNDKQLMSLLGLLYDAAANNSKWEPFLQQFSELFNSFGATITYADFDVMSLSFVAAYGFPMDDTPEYARLIPYDPRTPQSMNQEWHPRYKDPEKIVLLDRFQKGEPFRSSDIVTSADLHESEFYKVLCKPIDMEYVLCTQIIISPTCTSNIGLCRNTDQGDFSDDEIKMLQELRPHLERAVRLYDRLCNLDFERRTALETLNTVGMGVIIVDRKCNVFHSNTLAESIINNNKDIMTVGERFQFHRLEIDNWLIECVDELTASTETDITPSPRAINLPRKPPAAPLSLMISPLVGDLMKVESNPRVNPMAIVFIHDPSKEVSIPVELYRQQYDLTKAEARVLHYIINGWKVNDLASHLSVSVATVRSHLRKVFHKTQTSDQTELTRLVINGHAWVNMNSFSGTISTLT